MQNKDDYAWPNSYPVDTSKVVKTWPHEKEYTADNTWPEKYEKWHSVFTIQLGELVEMGLFDWSKEYLDWSKAAYDEEQYNRICDYFIDRFKWREISLEPFLEWATILKTKLVYELMPKYQPLYETISDGINPLSEYDEYYKEREITSAYPETMLSGNSDYASDGKDIENERIRLGNITERENQYIEGFRSIDKALLDELECMFVCMYSSNVNGY